MPVTWLTPQGREHLGHAWRPWAVRYMYPHPSGRWSYHAPSILRERVQLGLLTPLWFIILLTSGSTSPCNIGRANN